jgi:WD40 repeat protein
VVADGTRVRVIDATNGDDVGPDLTISGKREFISHVASDEHGTVLAYAYGEFHSRHVDVWSGVKRTLQREFEDIIALRVTPDGRRLIVADESGQVTFWNTNDGTKARAPFTGHIEEHLWKRGELSRDGGMLVEGEDNQFRLWDLQAGRPIGLPVVGHSSSSYLFAFSHNGRVLASAAKDGTIRLWDIATQQPIGAVLHAGSELRRLEFSPNGERLLSVTESGRLNVWRLDSKSWREVARRMITRNLSRKEWALYVGTEPYRRTFPDLQEPK